MYKKAGERMTIRDQWPTVFVLLSLALITIMLVGCKDDRPARPSERGRKLRWQKLHHRHGDHPLVFTATFVRFDTRRGPKGPVTAVLLRDIRHQRDHLANYMWLDLTQGFDRLGLRHTGERVQFEAQIRFDSQAGDWYLAHPSNVKRMEKQREKELKRIEKQREQELKRMEKQREKEQKRREMERKRREKQRKWGPTW